MTRVRFLHGGMMIQPLRLEIPAEVQTARLSLRSPKIGDGARIIDTVRSSLPELKPWLPWATDDYDVHDAEDWCRRAAASFVTREAAHYLIFTLTSSRHIGDVSTFALDWRVPKFEIGYWLASADVGQGYMTEAVTALTAMTFENFGGHRIEIHTDAENLRSAAVAERAGYVLEGILKNNCRNAEGKLRSDRIYARTP